MANITGTPGDDTIEGTSADDVIDGGAGKDWIAGYDGNDVINGGDDRDVLYGGNGDDQLNGGAGNDTFVGGSGQDTIIGGEGNDGAFGGGSNDQMYGGAGNDVMFGDGADDQLHGDAGDDQLFGGSGNDTLYGGADNDTLDGGTGDDTLIYQAGEGADVLAGGSGVDTLELRLAAGDVAGARNNIADFADWLQQQIASAGGEAAHAGQTTGPSFDFTALGLNVSAIEGARILVDGIEVPIEDFLNTAPTANATQTIAANEDVAINGSVGAQDADGDTLSNVVSQGPAHGTVTIDEQSGDFTYTPEDGYSGSDSFTVTVSDPDGASVEQVINVDVAPVADDPLMTIAQTDLVVSGAAQQTGSGGDDVIDGGAGNDVIDGGDGNDVINGDPPINPSFSVSLDIAASLADTDGSETLSIEISGVPQNGSLSAGTDQGNGVWDLSAGDLNGLTLNVSQAGDVALTVTATATESGGQTASVSNTINISFEAGTADGDDTLSGGAGNDTINGGVGNDTIVGGAGNDTIDGGDGFDTIDHSGSAGGVYVNLNAGFSSGEGFDTVQNVEGVIGSNQGDLIVGSHAGNVVEAGAGGDLVFTGSGDDVFKDGAGSGNDYYSGSTGTDTVDYSQAGSGVSVSLASGRASGSSSGYDRFNSIENAVGTGFADNLTGSSGSNDLSGGAGNDTLRGGRGADVLTGGAGDDTFDFERTDVASGNNHYGVDTITDFGAGDRLDLSSLLRGVRYNDISDVVTTTENANGTMISVEMRGSPGVTDVVFLDGVFDLDLDFLESNDLLIV